MVPGAERPAARTPVPCILLASSSPRRAALLRQLRVPFRVQAPAVDERREPGESPVAMARRLAVAKVRAADAPGMPTLGADTVVAAGERVFGKPADQAEFEAMLTCLAGAEHDVHTGVALRWRHREAVRVVSATVLLASLSETQMRAYWATGEPRDKAGGYAIQGIGAAFASVVRGSYSAVVGLPLLETEALMQAFGIDTWRWRSAAGASATP